MKFIIVTLFPEMFTGVLHTSMLWKAEEIKAVSYEVVNLRDYGIGPRKQVDDSPYGGGDGMVLRPEPIFACLEELKSKNPGAIAILPTPRGEMWDQKKAEELASQKDQTYIILCSHYEGYDERVIPLIDMQICLGKYILTGGEIPAMAIVDSVTRLLPGVLGGATSAEIESFSDGDNIEYPQYTRPETFRDQKVPEVLLSGHHGEIAKWRAENSR